MRAVAIAFLATAGSAAAQPVTSPYRCEVTIARAPEDVRDAIEEWVRREPRCTTTLEIRVVPSDGGLYLFARDAGGRSRERVVPDAQSVGALVASWIADDSSRSAPPGTPPDAPIEAPPASVQITPARSAREVIAPGVIAESSQWLTLGAMTMMHGAGGVGIRGELDVKTRGRWSLAVGLAGSEGAYLQTRDIRAVASLARTSTFGRWQLRIGAGAGVMHTTATTELEGVPIEAAGVFPTAELSVLFARRLGGAWALTAGPVVTWYAQRYETFRDGSAMTLERRDAELMAFGGLRHRM
jgi:hypothetical protein